jgi:hypothetical protein
MQTIRIVALLAVIFAAGVVTGRFTAPRPAPTVLSAGGRIITAETVLARLTQRVGLDAAQQEKIRPLLEELAKKMEALPPGTPQRLELHQASMPKVRALLRPEQYPAFDREVQESEAKIRRLIRQRAAGG